ncbi:MAG: LysM peptidoglycan-binding domain-containing protein [Alistipes sp.]|nr:LysM peptidoglycan-binding domain-containing protein [Alistipes sp.]
MPKSTYITPAVRRIALCIVLVVASVLSASPAEAFVRSLWRYGHGTYIDKFVSFVYSDIDIVDAPDDVVCDGIPYLADYILISKERQTLSVVDIYGRTICCYAATVGSRYGNKLRPGDYRTPEGEFLVCEIADASLWGNDANDGNGYIQHSYGNWFIRLLAPPHYGIGIHATLRRHNLGTRASEGCICLATEDLDQLQPLVREGMRVVVETSIRDMANDGRCYVHYKRYGTEYCIFDPTKYCGEFECDVVQDRVVHTVKRGDTLLSLAIKYSTSRKAIEALNYGVDLKHLAVGQKIVVRGSFSVVLDGVLRWGEEPENSGPEYYVATQIDTFGRIAVMHATHATKIQELNPDITPETLEPGMQVRVR